MARLTGHRRVAGPGGRPRRAARCSAARRALPVAAGRVERELAAPRAARASARASSSTRSARALAAAAARSSRALFDAQLLMLDDPLLVGPRRGDRRERARQRRVGGPARLRRVRRSCSTHRRPVPARAQGRRRRRRRAAAHEPAQGTSRGRASCSRTSTGRSCSSPTSCRRRWPRSSTGRACAASPSTPAAARPTPRSSRARSAVPAIVGLHERPRAHARPTRGARRRDGRADRRPDRRRAAAHRAAQAARTTAPAAERRRRRVGAAATTRDGVRVRLEANVESLRDVAAARGHGAEGIGLFRSEFLLPVAAFRADGPASEAAQSRPTARVRRRRWRRCRSRSARSTSTRTRCATRSATAQLEPDVGARSRPSACAASARPRAGPRSSARRSARCCAPRRTAPLRILLPFVTSVEEVRAARRARSRDAAPSSPRASRRPRVPVGAMIEVPAAALTADLLARGGRLPRARHQRSRSSTCWPSIGPTSACRGFYEPLHPACCADCAGAARGRAAHGMPLSVCGEMASDPALLAAARRPGLTRVQHDAAARSGRQADARRRATRASCHCAAARRGRRRSHPSSDYSRTGRGKSS